MIDQNAFRLPIVDHRDHVEDLQRAEDADLEAYFAAEKESDARMWTEYDALVEAGEIDAATGECTVRIP